MGVLFLSLAAVCVRADGPTGRGATELPPALRGPNPVSLEQPGRPLDEVLRALSRPAGVTLRASGGLEFQKVTILLHRLPLKDAVQALAAGVDGQWEQRRTGTGRLEYVLVPSDRRKARLVRFRQVWQDAEARCVEMLMDNLEQRLAGGRKVADPNSPAPELTSYPEPLFPLARLLPREVLRRLVVEGRDAYRVGGQVGADKETQLYVPVAMLGPDAADAVRAFRRASIAEARASGIPEDRIRGTEEQERQAGQNILKFWTLRSPQSNRLAFDLFVSVAQPGGAGGYDTCLATTQGPPIPEFAEPEETLLAEGATWESPIEREREVTLPAGLRRSDHGLLEAARAANVSMVADYFTRGLAFELSPNGMPSTRPLAAVLASYERTYRSHPVRHFWLGATLVVRSERWPYALDREPSVKVTDRWEASLATRRKLGLDDYMAAAQLLDGRQIPVLAYHLPPDGKAQDAEGHLVYRESARTLGRHRHALRGLAALTAAQRRQAAVDEQGLPFPRLSAQQQSAWKQALKPFELLLGRGSTDQLRLRLLPAQGEHPIPRLFLVGMPHVGTVPVVPDP